METIKIGEQVWSAENLDVEHYRNGDVIPQVLNKDDWANLKTGAWYYHKNKKFRGNGKLYNWYAVADKRGLAPKGYHIPTRKEFEKLIRTVKGDANSLKAKGAGGGTNKSGFKAQYNYSRDFSGGSYGRGYIAEFWSKTKNIRSKAYSFHLYFNSDRIHIFALEKGNGFSVRVIKDDK